MEKLQLEQKTKLRSLDENEFAPPNDQEIIVESYFSWDSSDTAKNRSHYRTRGREMNPEEFLKRHKNFPQKLM